MRSWFSRITLRTFACVTGVMLVLPNRRGIHGLWGFPGRSCEVGELCLFRLKPGATLRLPLRDP